MRRLGVMFTLMYLWTTSLPQRLAVRPEERDRGDGLSTAAIAVGMLIIVGIVIAILKTKATHTAESVCTNADPSTCQ